MIKEIVATLLLSGSIGANTQRIESPRKLREDYNIYGVYNFKEHWSFGDIESYLGQSTSIVFETQGQGTDESPLWSYCCPLSLNDSNYQQLYLKSIDIVTFNDYSVDIDFNCYDLFLNDFNESITIEQGDDFLDFSCKAMMFSCRQNILLHGFSSIIFDWLFTTEDNSLLTTYTGYYSFITTTTTLPSRFCAFGSLVFNNNMSIGFTNYGINLNSVAFYQFDAQINQYINKTYSLPFDTSVVSTKNILCNGLKMSIGTKNLLSDVGIFSYVRDSAYDNTDFKDLMFSVMDSPIYMLSRLLGFELFGVNLYIALASLLTIVALLVLIRKFF